MYSDMMNLGRLIDIDFKPGTLVLAIVASLSILSCKDINYIVPVREPIVDIYLAGAKINGTDTAWSATYWKNGVPTSLTNGLVNSNLFGVSVSDSGVYVAGYEGIELKYWRNGISYSIGDTSRALAISAVNDDVYIAGWTKNNTAVYWKNGIQTILGPHAAATTIDVISNDVYLGGYQGSVDLTTSIVWKNNSPLNDIQGNGQINSIVVVGTDVYSAGNYLPLASQNLRACYWKNSTLVILSDGVNVGSANSIFVSGSDIYVAGYETNSNGVKVARYWKNGIAKSVSDGTRSQEVHAIVVANGDVYLTCDGPVPHSSILMKNENMVAPFDGSSNRYYAFGLAIRTR